MNSFSQSVLVQPPTDNNENGHQHEVAINGSSHNHEASKLLASDTFKSQNNNYKLYKRRWVVLFLFSSIALFNNVICYTFAAIHNQAKIYYEKSLFPSTSTSTSTSSSSAASENIHLTTMVSCFFITYCIFSFPSSWFIEKYGLRQGVIVGSTLQVLGCGLRWMAVDSQIISEYNCVWLGQIIASLGQAFFVNPPALLASSWFGADERTLATTIAVNANTLGIAVIYLTAPQLVHTPDDLPYYLGILFYVSAALAFLSVFMPSKPPTPPSRSQETETTTITKNTNNNNNNNNNNTNNTSISLSSIQDLFSIFRHRGFIHTLLVFALAEATINGVSAFMNPMLLPLGYDNQFVGVLASAFIIMCMLGSAIVGYYVDKTREYKTAVIVSGVCACMCIIYFIQSGNHTIHVILSICLSGFFIGPLQPIAIEAGVECTYPTPGSSVTAVQQVVGNLASAAFFPFMLLLRDPTDPNSEMVRPLWFIAACLGGISIMYVSFNGEYKRLQHENEWDRRHSTCNAAASGYGSINGNGQESDALIQHHQHQHDQHQHVNGVCGKDENCGIVETHCHAHEKGVVVDGIPRRKPSFAHPVYV